MVRRSKIKISAILALMLLFCLLLNVPVSAEIPQKVRVGIITGNSGSQYRNANNITFTVKGAYQLMDLSGIPGMGLIGTAAEDEEWQIFYLPTGMQISKNGELIKVTTGPVVIRELAHGASNRVFLKNFTANGSTTYIGKWYRGDMEFRSSASSILAINELPMDEYLYGVVPREMSNSWPIEALKAQAIAARTYAAANINKHIVEGFNFLDTPNDQVYAGFNGEGATATRAVDETSGQIITYDGSPISAVYHSTSGGYTEDNENVWAGKPSGYLRAKNDPYSTTNGLANWTYTSSLEEVREKLINAGSDIGPINAINLEKYRSGRVKAVIIRDINGNTIAKSGSEFGKLFNPQFYTYINNTSFMSNFFDVKMDNQSESTVSTINGSSATSKVSGTGLYGVSDDGTIEILNDGGTSFYALGASETAVSVNKAPTGAVIFEGHGWGHGVGMSQWGAYQMASQGKTYSEIIKFYYTGVEISN